MALRRAFQNGDRVLLIGIFLVRKPLSAFDWRARNERVARLDVCLVGLVGLVCVLPVVGEWPPIILPVWFGLWGRWCTGCSRVKGECDVMDRGKGKGSST